MNSWLGVVVCVLTLCQNEYVAKVVRTSEQLQQLSTLMAQLVQHITSPPPGLGLGGGMQLAPLASPPAAMAVPQMPFFTSPSVPLTAPLQLPSLLTTPVQELAPMRLPQASAAAGSAAGPFPSFQQFLPPHLQHQFPGTQTAAPGAAPASASSPASVAAAASTSITPRQASAYAQALHSARTQLAAQGSSLSSPLASARSGAGAGAAAATQVTMPLGNLVQLLQEQGGSETKHSGAKIKKPSITTKELRQLLKKDRKAHV